MVRNFIFFLVLFYGLVPHSAAVSVPVEPGELLLLQQLNVRSCQTDSLPGKRIRKENPRAVAALLCATLGVFGVHRMYLGTDVKVPVFYTLTIGGGVGGGGSGYTGGAISGQTIAGSGKTIGICFERLNKICQANIEFFILPCHLPP